MKNKETVLNTLLIMLAGLIHSPTQAQQKHGAKMSLTSSMSKKIIQQIGLTVFLFPIIK